MPWCCICCGGSILFQETTLWSRSLFEPGWHFVNNCANKANCELSLKLVGPFLGQTFHIKSEQTYWNLKEYLKVRRWHAGRTVCVWQQTEAALGCRHASSSKGGEGCFSKRLDNLNSMSSGIFLSIFGAHHCRRPVHWSHSKTQNTTRCLQFSQMWVRCLKCSFVMCLKDTLKSLTSVTKLQCAETPFQVAFFCCCCCCFSCLCSSFWGIFNIHLALIVFYSIFSYINITLIIWKCFKKWVFCITTWSLSVWCTM